MTITHEELETGRLLLAEIATAERHFNEIQSRYRAIASTWLLSGFAGMGFVAANENLPLPYEPIIFGIGLSVATGVSLLWVLDQIVFGNLFGAYFLEGLRLESRYPNLTQARHNMFGLFGRFRVRRYVSLFYAACLLVPSLAGFAIAFNWLWEPGSLALKTFFILMLCAVLLVALRMCFYGPSEEYSRRLKELEKMGAEDLLTRKASSGADAVPNHIAPNTGPQADA